MLLNDKLYNALETIKIDDKFAKYVNSENLLTTEACKQLTIRRNDSPSLTLKQFDDTVKKMLFYLFLNYIPIFLYHDR